MTDTPTLETERLRLRWLTLDDTPLMLAVWNDPAFVRHVGDRGIRTTEQAEQVLRDSAFNSYDEHGYGPFHISLKSGDAPIGVCGLFIRNRVVIWNS
ncbi:MAG: GNAT family N-acetyltransferase [Woeseiaceae bacterium]